MPPSASSPGEAAKGIDTVEPQIRVAAVGLPHCSNISLQVALQEILKFGSTMPPLNSASRFPLPLVPAAYEALDTENRLERQALLRHLFNGYTSVCDSPGWWFADDICDLYPGVKMILNIRPEPPKAWHASLKDLLGLPFGVYCRLFAKLFPDRNIHIFIRNDFIIGRYNVYSLYGPEFYEAHNSFIREMATEKGVELLEWHADMGWEPLCEFLGVEKPDAPFPKMDEKRFKERVKRLLLAIVNQD